MSINTFNYKFINNQQLRLGIESRIDELTEIENKICAKLMKTPDCVQEAPQPFIDTNPDYVNPLKLKDNSSRIRVLEHIAKAELLAENDSDYVMQPFPLYDSISWILKSQIPIKNYEFTPNVDLEPIKSSGSTFPSSLQPIVTSTDEEWLDSNNGAGIRNTQLQVIPEEYCGDNKSEDVSPVNIPIANKNDVIFGVKNPEVNIYSNKFKREDELGALDFGVIGEKNKKPENQSRYDCIMDVFSRNYANKRETNGLFWPVEVTRENYDSNNALDKKTNLKFQYAAVIGDNLEKEIPNSEDCIVLVCKECGFQEYI